MPENLATPTDADKDKTPLKDPDSKNRHKWLRRFAKVVGAVIIFILIIPILLYLPPVQKFAVKTAVNIVADKTGMNIGIERFRLKFPVDLSLQGVSIVEASGDTMVRAKEIIADVKLRPLINLDVQIRRLRLVDAYYRMISPDSSMLMTLRAGLLDVDDQSSANIGKSEILLNEATLKDADISLEMDVWKQKTEPKDSSSTPFLITANRLKIERINFSMMMLPTIDTLRFAANSLSLEKGIIDLRKNNIGIAKVSTADGTALMLAPSAEYVKAHPAPPADTTASSEPMTISVDDISLVRFNARYAVADALPAEGFDPSDIRADGLNLTIANFFNRSAEISLPITSLRVDNLSGLTVTEGTGVFSMDSTGMNLKDFNIRTPFSSIEASAKIPNSLLELQPEAPLDVNISASLGMPDINAFIPSASMLTGALSKTTTLNALLKASGTLDNADIPQLDVALPQIFSIRAKGKAQNALDFKNLVAQLSIDGELSKPSIITQIAPIQGVNIPKFKISGSAAANKQNYTADLKLITPEGQLAANGKVGLNSERYNAVAKVLNLNVGYFIDNPEIGPITASLEAIGAGFNPEKHSSHTDIKLRLDHAVYNKHDLNDIFLLASLSQGNFTLSASSPSPLLSFDINGAGTIAENDYQADITAKINNIDLQSLGLSETPNGGAAVIHLSGSASPHTWIYDADLTLSNIDWSLGPDRYYVADPLNLKLKSGADNTLLTLNGPGTSAEFQARSGLQVLVDKFSFIGAMLPQMIKDRRINVEALEQNLPQFSLSANASGAGLASEFLEPTGMSFRNFNLNLRKDSLIAGNMTLRELNTGSMRLDTISFDLSSRGNLLDYKLHLGNRPGTLDEFAQVNMSGYAGENRLSAFLNQRNIKGKTGYRLGFTASVADSVLSLRFTPLKATIAYLPWNFNMDNYIDFNIENKHLDANLLASSEASSILVKTEPGKDGFDNLHLNLTNIHVEDFLSMALNAPPVKASINSDILIRYTGKALVGKGNLDIDNLVYERRRVGDFKFNLQAGMGKTGKSAGKVGMIINGSEAAAVQFVLAPDSVNPDNGLVPERLKLVLTRFPLDIANPFFPPRTMKLSGALNGDMSLSGTFAKPILNGQMACNDVAVFFNMLGTDFRFGSDPITVTDNVLDFHDFDILAVNENPLSIRGTVDARKLSDIAFDLTANAHNMQLVGGKSRSADLSGKLFVDLDAAVKGPMSMMDINAFLNILPETDVTYRTPPASDAVEAQKRAEGMVQFVNFNDSVQVAAADSIAPSMAMRITAQAVISQGAAVTVDLGGDSRVVCNPSGTLNYFQNFLGDMKLNGTLYTGTGFVNYVLPVVGKTFLFNFDRDSHVSWNGDIMNPMLDINANNTVKANIQSGGVARLVNFLVSLAITNNLAAPSVAFDLATDDDISISNELQSMTPQQRQQQAISLMITGTYTGPGAKSVGQNLLTGSLYSALTSTLNTLAANAIKGVDINFGVDQYQVGNNGNTSTTTSYSYQVSKSLINNRFKILVGGNYSTDASADENFQQNLISDIAFEYVLKQTNNMSLNAKLYRHTGFESVLEGEITETGLGLSLRRRLAYFTEITHFGLSKLWKKKKPILPDSIISPEVNSIPNDSLNSILRKDDDDEK